MERKLIKTENVQDYIKKTFPRHATHRLFRN